jgi:hypothetical protein
MWLESHFSAYPILAALRLKGSMVVEFCEDPFEEMTFPSISRYVI